MDAIQFFANSKMAARFWMCIAILAIAAAIISPTMIVNSMKQTEKVIIMDEANVFSVAPTVGIEDASKMQQYISQLAVEAMFNKTAAGPDNLNLLKQVYLPAAAQDVKTVYDKEGPDFKARNIHQFVECRQIKITPSTPDIVKSEVEAQLIRVIGEKDSVDSIVETYKLQVHFVLIRNKDMRSNGKLPMAVFKMIYRTDRI